MISIHPQLIPAFLVNSENEFTERLRAVEHVSPLVQIDIMDGTLVAPRSWADAETISRLSPVMEYELHLMVNEPRPIIEAWHAKVPGLRRTIWHVEAPLDHTLLLSHCKERGIEAGLAISPQTNLDAITSFLPLMDELLILGVRPGASGQALIESTLHKATEAHRQFPDLTLGFDGGVSLQTTERILATGVQRLYAASAIFHAPKPAQAITEFQKLIESTRAHI